MEITKKYLDEQFSKLAMKQDVRDAIDELARITNVGFDEVYRRLDVREQVEKHEHDIQELKRALNLA
jgi:hypothetical protein